MKPSIYAILSIIAVLASCAPAYIPNKANVGFFKEKGELHGEIATGTSGYDPQVAYAATDHIAVVANASFRNSPFESKVSVGEESFTYTGKKKHQIYEMGIGYYDTNDSGLTFEVIGGYGMGRVSDMEVSGLNFRMTNKNTLKLVDGETALLSADFKKWFIQPTIGITHENVDFGVTSKFSNVRMTILNERYNDWFFEPVATLRFGIESVKLTSQLGISIPMSGEINYVWQPFMFSMGIMVDVNVFGRKD